MAKEKVLPWSETCFVCGDANPFGLRIKFVDRGDDVIVRTTVDRHFEGYPGRVHGGVVTALLDETIGWACSVKAHKMLYTVEIKVRFRKPVPGGEELIVRGWCSEMHKRFAKGQGQIEGRDGTVMVSAEGLYFPVPDAEETKIIPMLKMPGRPAQPGDY